MYATAASPYASNAGQKRSSANCDCLVLGLALRASSRELGQLRHLAFEPSELRRDDQDVRENDDEDDEVRSCDVLLRARHDASTSRSSFRRWSRRLPTSSTWYSVAASASRAAHDMQNAK